MADDWEIISEAEALGTGGWESISEEEALSLPKEPKTGFIGGLTERPSKFLPFYGGMIETEHLLSVQDAAKRLEADKYDELTPETTGWGLVESPEKYVEARKMGAWTMSPYLSGTEAYEKLRWTPERQREHDIQLVDEWLEKQKEKYTAGGRVGQVVGEIPAFAAEIAATGGVYSGTKQATEKVLAKYTASKLAPKVGGWAAGSVARATLGMPQRITEAYGRRRLPKDVNVDEAGNVTFDWPDEKPYTSFAKAWGDIVIEVASEEAGAGLRVVGKGALAKLPFGQKFLSTLHQKYIKLHPNIKWGEFIQKVMKVGGYNGILEELGEEYLGDAMRAIADVDDFGAGPEANVGERLVAALNQDVKNTPIMAAAFAVPGVGGRLAGIASAPPSQAKIETVARKIQESKLNDYEKAMAIQELEKMMPGEEISTEVEVKFVEAEPVKAKPVEKIKPAKLTPERQEAIREYNRKISEWIEKGKPQGEKPVKPIVEAEPVKAKPAEFIKGFSGRVSPDIFKDSELKWMNQPTVDAMAEGYKEGNETLFARPIAVIPDGKGGISIVEGTHRAAAAKKAGVNPPIAVVANNRTELEGMNAPEVDALAKKMYETTQAKPAETAPLRKIETKDINIEGEEALQQYRNKLENPELVDRAIIFETYAGQVPAIPVGKARETGEFDAGFGIKDDAKTVLYELQKHTGFPNLHIKGDLKSGYRVVWGKELEDDLSDEAQAEAYGYKESAVTEWREAEAKPAEAEPVKAKKPIKITGHRVNLKKGGLNIKTSLGEGKYYGFDKAKTIEEFTYTEAGPENVRKLKPDEYTTETKEVAFQNPLIIDSQTKLQEIVEKIYPPGPFGDMSASQNYMNLLPTRKSNPEIGSWAQQQGYDGIILKINGLSQPLQRYFGVDQMVVFEKAKPAETAPLRKIETKDINIEGKKALQQYRNKLENPELVDRAIIFETYAGQVPAIPVGKARETGEFDAGFGIKDDAKTVLNELQKHTGFPNLHIKGDLKSGYRVVWGKELESDLSDEAQAEAYGYKESAVTEWREAEAKPAEAEPAGVPTAGLPDIFNPKKIIGAQKAIAAWNKNKQSAWESWTPEQRSQYLGVAAGEAVKSWNELRPELQKGFVFQNEIRRLAKRKLPIEVAPTKKVPGIVQQDQAKGLFEVSESAKRRMITAKKFEGILTELETKRPEIKKTTKENVGKNLQAMKEIYEDLSEEDPVQAQIAARAIAKGMAREQIPELEVISREEIDDMRQAIREAHTIPRGDLASLMTFFDAIQHGVQPYESHIEIFDKFFGTKILQRAQKKGVPLKKGVLRKIGRGIRITVNTMKAVLASIDVSAGGIQAWPNFIAHPKVWWKGLGKGYRAAFSEEYLNLTNLEIKTNPLYNIVNHIRPDYFTELEGLSTEELFQEELAYKIPVMGEGIKMSARAHMNNLNYQRAALAYDWLERNLDASDAAIEQALDHFGNMTGRGKLGKAEKYAKELGAIFWAPKMRIAKFKWWAIDIFTKPEIRKLVAADLVANIGFMLTLLGLFNEWAEKDENVSVEFDPRSTDFPCIKIGNLRIRPFAQETAMVRYIIQAVLGIIPGMPSRKATATGRTYHQGLWKTTTRYLRGAMAPGPGIAWDVLTKRTFRGEKTRWTDPKFTSKYIYEHITPLFIQDVIDTAKYQGFGTAILTAPIAFHGIGMQTYEIHASGEAMQLKNSYAHKVYGCDWDELGPVSQKALRKYQPMIGLYEDRAQIERSKYAYENWIDTEERETGRRVKKHLDNNIQKELDRLELPFGSLGRRISSRWFLNQKRYKEYQNKTIKLINQVVPTLIDSPAWKDLPVEMQREMLDEMVGECKKAVRQSIITNAKFEDVERMMP